ncbi:hypothetical protein FOZ63_025881 [Perkinsus olseni]|uniref:Uncharacterized protein n=1 Tax=Perkinsus olseni TaxID=32597 RepID=A0A7J6P3F6_PEROL|nr:hypothetical protein FOZ63_025881 [Perkinsus olseni]
MPRDWVRDAIKRDFRRAEAAKRGGFSSIHRPRTRQEKKVHVETLDKVPFELVPAMEARKGGVSGLGSSGQGGVNNRGY